MAKTRNRYFYPLDPEKFRMYYKKSPAHKGRLKHAADFIAPEGTPIHAALGGVVVDIRQDSDIGGVGEKFDMHGNYIEIQHANHIDEEYSIYEHIRKNGSLVKIGDKVKKGQVIGYSGNTGWMAHLGPHLHFDVHKYRGEGPEDYETLQIQWASK